ncbi:MAG: KEOPS complex subunit Cgi121 [Halobacteriaceae archaeon]
MRVVEGAATVADTDDFVARLTDIGETHDCAVQAFDARLVVDRAHLETAVARADRAFERGENVARNRAVEILLYAAGRRQIDRALEMGVAEGTGPVVAVVAGDDEAGAVAAVRSLLDPGTGLDATDERAVCEFFEVSDAERRASSAGLSALVRERVALLDVEK